VPAAQHSTAQARSSTATDAIAFLRVVCAWHAGGLQAGLLMAVKCLCPLQVGDTLCALSKADWGANRPGARGRQVKMGGDDSE
jgi:hypothetical protein